MKLKKWLELSALSHFLNDKGVFNSHNITEITIGAAKDVKIAPKPMATPATAPCKSPSSAASAVPCPCAIVPKASPLESGLVTPVLFINHGPIIVPAIPVIITKATVKVGSPPIIFDISIATGVVADLILIDAISIFESPKNFANRTPDKSEEKEPTTNPKPTGKIFLKTMLRFLYKGTASATVAGPNRKVIISLAKLYSSYSISNSTRIVIIIGVLKKTGVVNGDGNFLDTILDKK